MEFNLLNPEPTDVYQGGSGMLDAAFAFGFINRTGIPLRVTIGTQSKIVAVNNDSRVASREFIITTAYNRRYDETLMVEDLETGTGNRIANENVRGFNSPTTVKYVLSGTDLNPLFEGHGINIDKLGICITKPDSPYAIPQRLSAFNYDPVIKPLTTISVYVVDSTELVKDRYIKVAGFIYKIVLTRSTGLPNGVYLVSSCGGESQCMYYKTDSDTEVFKIFRTYAEAERWDGSDDLTYKRELLSKQKLEAERELESVRQETAREKIRMEQREREFALDQINAKAELDDAKKHFELKAKAVDLRTKSYYETRSMDRKDTSEVSKFVIPLLVAAGTALVGAFL